MFKECRTTGIIVDDKVVPAYLVVGRTLFTNKNIAFSLGRLILLRIMYINCATAEERRTEAWRFSGMGSQEWEFRNRDS